MSFWPDQRKTHRRNLKVRCRVTDGTAERFARLADIGLGGARVLTAGPPAVGAVLVMYFPLHDGGTIEAEARVVWRTEGFGGRGGVMGVEFLVVSSPNQLRALIDGAA